MSMPSPILILGDRNISQNNVNIAKKKYDHFTWLTFSGKNHSLDYIRTNVGQEDFFSSSKIVLIKELENKKDFRSFLIDLANDSSEKLKFIIWDSENIIKQDPSKKTFSKTWQDFIDDIKKFPDHKIINNGVDFIDKDVSSSNAFIQERFKKYKKQINAKNAQIFSEIVGKNRGLLTSEIDKLSLISPEKISEDFILENAFPSSKEAVLYKFGNSLDSGCYEASIIALEEFLDMRINENVLAEVIVRKTRWQLIAASFWEKGYSWKEISKEMMQMGKYPSSIWHQESINPSEKRKASENLKDLSNRMQYMHKVCGMKKWQINWDKKASKAEVMPMEFMAEASIKYLRQKIIARYINEYKEKELKNKLLNRCINVHKFVLRKLMDIRYGECTKQDLYLMIEAITSKSLD